MQMSIATQTSIAMPTLTVILGMSQAILTGLITRNIAGVHLTRTGPQRISTAEQLAGKPRPIAKLRPGNKSTSGQAAHPAIVQLLEAGKPRPIAKLTPGNKSTNGLAAHRVVVQLLEAENLQPIAKLTPANRPSRSPAAHLAVGELLEAVQPAVLVERPQRVLEIVIPRGAAVEARAPLVEMGATTVPALALRVAVVLPAWQAGVEVLAPEEAEAAGKRH